jgi:ribosome-binding protein aMBF1 (putative translation factor)
VIGPRDIRRLRGQLGATQAAFAQLIHAHWTTISRWENGRTVPDEWQRHLLETIWAHVRKDPRRADAASRLVQEGNAPAALAILLQPAPGGRR